MPLPASLRRFVFMLGAGSGAALVLLGIVLVCVGLMQPAVDVGVIVRGVLVYLGLGSLAAGGLLLGLAAAVRRLFRVNAREG